MGRGIGLQARDVLAPVLKGAASSASDAMVRSVQPMLGWQRVANEAREQRKLPTGVVVQLLAPKI